VESAIEAAAIAALLRGPAASFFKWFLLRKDETPASKRRCDERLPNTVVD
jgi:hypothetical protein